MFSNYFKTTWRYLLKDRQFTILNLVGLSTGMACTLLICLWISDEWQTDRFHKNDQRLFQVMINEKNAGVFSTTQGTGGVVGEIMQKQLPEVEYTVTTTPAAWFQQFSISWKDRTVGATGNLVGKDYFKMFSYPLLQGNKENVLADKNSVVISAQLARKLFNTIHNVIGRTLEWKWASLSRQCTVTGVFEDMPVHSTSRFDFVLSLDIWKDIMPVTLASTSTGPFNTYVMLRKGTDVQRFSEKLPALLKSQFKDSSSVMFMRKYADGYLYDKYENGVQAGGRISYLRLFSIIALFILVIACINFMNLSTAKASGRMKEIGVKKSLGAARRTLVFQFLGESLFMSIAALLIALLMVALLLPRFSEMTGKQLLPQWDIRFIAAVLGITLFTGLLAGSYPALYLSRFAPSVTLKGKFSNTGNTMWIRKGLVVFQFVVSVIFIIAVMVVYKQVQFVQSRNLGYNKDNIVYFEMEGRVGEKKEAFLADLKDLPGVVNASSIEQKIVLSSFLPTSNINWEGKNLDNQIRFYEMPVNYGLIETLGIQMAAGRAFSKDFSTDSTAVVLNEAAIKVMGLTDPVGKIINRGNTALHIIGVTKNFHFNSLHEEIRPFIFNLAPAQTLLIMARIQQGREQATLAGIQQLYKTFNPGYSFNYKFLDNDYQAQYASEKLVAQLSGYFAGLTIIISCLGLFGLAAFTAERRRKEIGIRKVLGATVGNVAVMLSKDFLQLILIAVCIAFPLAWWAAGEWLQSFAYHIHIGVSVFLAAGAATLGITLLTIGFQALKAGWTNPVKSLRSE
ncbi:duplicated orphan permease [Chitinophaga rupis]|uniref:Duplicated orphan permease n=1 Tax=Chitinophaga rupis TaxID=573321 RepID=A0A1H7GMQ4_9BACT|nr:ABC transporter permease [Chitinophaga rupis]SEK39354.1 duplicated orphan permease [Chitinophaga rupis]